MFILDFDDTLFDTHAFKQARLEAVRALGVSEDMYWQTYEQALKNGDGLYTYSDERHATMLAVHGFDKDDIQKALADVSSQAQSFLNDYALDFLEFLKEQNKEMVLLSLGDRNFQDLKTRGSGIFDYFDRVFMVDDTKAHILAKIFKDNKDTDVWFINDKVGETAELLTQFPDMKVVLKMSPKFDKAEYVNSGLPHFEDLKEIENYVGEHIG